MPFACPSTGQETASDDEPDTPVSLSMVPRNTGLTTRRVRPPASDVAIVAGTGHVAPVEITVGRWSTLIIPYSAVRQNCPRGTQKADISSIDGIGEVLAAASMAALSLTQSSGVKQERGHIAAQ